MDSTVVRPDIVAAVSVARAFAGLDAAGWVAAVAIADLAAGSVAPESPDSIPTLAAAAVVVVAVVSAAASDARAAIDD